LAALRGGIDTVLIPKDNVKDLKEIPDNIKQGLKIIPVHWITEVLEQALVTMPKPREGDAGDDTLLSNEKASYHGVGSENRH
jgi:ATP-dependent Lon protease